MLADFPFDPINLLWGIPLALLIWIGLAALLVYLGYQCFANLASRSRFRLAMEQSLCALVLLLAGGILRWAELVGVLMMGGCLVYLRRINRELKTKSEPLTGQQKQVLFGFYSTILSVVVVGVLATALLKNTPLVWIAFGLAVICTAAGLVFLHGEIYGNERGV